MDRDVSAQRAHAGAGGGHRSGALLAVDGQYLYVGEFGHLFWLGLTPQGYAETSRAWLFAARESWTLPVLSRGLLYVRQNTRDVFDQSSPSNVRHRVHRHGFNQLEHRADVDPGWCKEKLT